MPDSATGTMTVEQNLNYVFKISFDIFKKQYVALILATLIALVGSILIITAPPLFFGIYWMASQAAKGKRVKTTDVFRGFDYFLTSWALFILWLVMFIIGLILLVIPGILVTIMFQYAVALAINEKLGAIDALKKSYSLARANFSYSFILWLAVMVLLVLGGATRIGNVVTIPFAALLLTVASSRLTGKKSAPHAKK